MDKRIILLLAVLLTALYSCTSDGEIKGDIAAKARKDWNFSHVNYTVNKGIVKLTGNCISEASKSKVEAAVKGTAVVKGVINNIQVDSLAQNVDPVIKQSVDSVLESYPKVWANITATSVVLNGSATLKEWEKIWPGIQKLHLPKLSNQVNVK